MEKDKHTRVPRNEFLRSRGALPRLVFLEFSSTVEGKKLTDPTTLGQYPASCEFLFNRLFRAFEIGYACAEVRSTEKTFHCSGSDAEADIFELQIQSIPTKRR